MPDHSAPFRRQALLRVPLLPAILGVLLVIHVMALRGEWACRSLLGQHPGTSGAVFLVLWSLVALPAGGLAPCADPRTVSRARASTSLGVTVVALGCWLDRASMLVPLWTWLAAEALFLLHFLVLQRLGRARPRLQRAYPVALFFLVGVTTFLGATADALLPDAASAISGLSVLLGPITGAPAPSAWLVTAVLAGLVAANIALTRPRTTPSPGAGSRQEAEPSE